MVSRLVRNFYFFGVLTVILVFIGVSFILAPKSNFVLVSKRFDILRDDDTSEYFSNVFVAVRNDGDVSGNITIRVRLLLDYSVGCGSARANPPLFGNVLMNSTSCFLNSGENKTITFLFKMPCFQEQPLPIKSFTVELK